MINEAPISPNAVYIARPVIEVDQQIHAEVSELLVSMEMIEQETGLSTLELCFTNWSTTSGGRADFAFEDDEILKLGARLRVGTGDENDPREIFRGMITGLEMRLPESDPPQLIVLAEDLLQQARMTQHSITYEDASIADIAQEIAGRLGLQAQVSGFTQTIGVQVQVNESDLAFLRRLLLCYDGDLQINETELHVAPRAEIQRGSGPIVLARDSQLRSATLLADLAHQVNAVTIAGWDASNGERIGVESGNPDLGTGSGTTGGEFLTQAIEQRFLHVHHHAVTNTEEAQALADAIFAKRARRFVTVTGIADGNAAIRVGAQVELQGTGRFDNTYYVTRAEHRWDNDEGYLTEFEAECSYWIGN